MALDEFHAWLDEQVVPGPTQDSCSTFRLKANVRGYPKVSGPGGTTLLVSRLLLERKLGRELAPKELACHTCDNPRCVNVDHLFLGTKRDNALDALSKNRLATGCRNGSYTHPECRPRGEENKRSKLTAAIVREARVLKRRGWEGSELAKRFGVSKSTMCYALRGVTWKHVST